MGIYAAFFLGVLVGHWILLIAIWRAIVSLGITLNALENDIPVAPHEHKGTDIRLLDDGGQRRRSRQDDW